MLTQIADSFLMEQEVIDLPKPIVAWFQSNLDNFDLSESGQVWKRAGVCGEHLTVAWK